MGILSLPAFRFGALDKDLVNRSSFRWNAMAMKPRMRSSFKYNYPILDKA